MFNFRTATEVAAYCAATVVIGTGVCAAIGVYDVQLQGVPTAGDYQGIPANFADSAVSEPGRVTDLRACDIAPETGTFYEVGPCSDHESNVAATYGTYPYPQGR